MRESPIEETESRRRAPSVAWGLALVVVVGLASHARSLRGEFVFDDRHAVQENPVVQGAAGLGAAFTTDYWGGRSVGTWRPLPVLSFRLDQVMGGGAPWVFHLTNLLLHALACLALALALGGATGRPWLGVGAGLLYAVLAINTEAVASIVGRADVLAAGLCWTSWALLGRGKGPLRLGAAGLVFLGALLSKESVLAFPLVLYGIDALLGSCWPRPWASRYLALLGAVAVYFVLRFSLYGVFEEVTRTTNNNPLLVASLDQRLWTGFRLFFLSIRLVLAPLNLSADYSYAEILPEPHPGGVDVIGGIGAVALLVVAVWRLRRSQPVVAAGLAGFALAWAPLSNVVVLLPVILAERLLYFPAAFGAIALAGLAVAGRGPWRRVTLALVAAIALGNLVRGIARDGDWRDELSLFQATVEASPRAARGWLNLGVALLKRGEPQKALAALGRARRIAPRWAKVDSLTGAALDELGRARAAESLHRRAALRDPTCGECARHYAIFLARHRRFREAARQLRAYVARRPASHKARALLRRLEADISRPSRPRPRGPPR